jgi:hypothetical protein
MILTPVIIVVVGIVTAPAASSAAPTALSATPASAGAKEIIRRESFCRNIAFHAFTARACGLFFYGFPPNYAAVPAAAYRV